MEGFTVSMVAPVSVQSPDLGSCFMVTVGKASPQLVYSGLVQDYIHRPYSQQAGPTGRVQAHPERQSCIDLQ